MEILVVLRRGLVMESGKDINGERALTNMIVEWRQTGLTPTLRYQVEQYLQYFADESHQQYLQYFADESHHDTYRLGGLPAEFYPIFLREFQALDTPNLAVELSRNLRKEVEYLDPQFFNNWSRYWDLIVRKQMYDKIWRRSLDHLNSLLVEYDETLHPFYDMARREWIQMLAAKIQMMLSFPPPVIPKSVNDDMEQ